MIDETPKIRVIFMGTPKIAAAILSELAEKKYEIVCVITKPDSAIGRNKEVKESAVKQKALEYKLPIEQPEKLDQITIEKIKKLKPDLIIVAAYGKILPPEILSIPGFGCVNVHASLLPKWRGASPIQNALLSGETETGVTIMLMDEGMDTGDILAQKKINIGLDETKEDLLLRLTEEGKNLLMETVPLWVERKIIATPQDNTEATLCQLIERDDGHIIWTDSAESIYNRYRALFNWPGIFSFWEKDKELLRLKLHHISYQKHSPQISYPVGQVFELGEKVGVQTGSGVVFLEEVQLEGKNKMPIKEFLLGNKEIIGGFLR
jgi:methionyl-tRNA formyltransferase